MKKGIDNVGAEETSGVIGSSHFVNAGLERGGNEREARGRRGRGREKTLLRGTRTRHQPALQNNQLARQHGAHRLPALGHAMQRATAIATVLLRPLLTSELMTYRQRDGDRVT